MKRNILSINLFSRLKAYFYKFFMPAITVILLLVISQIISRPMFLGSKLFDLQARIWLCFTFCMGCIIMSDLNLYQSLIFSGKTEPLYVHNDKAPSCWNIVMGVIFGILAVLISWWSIKIFVPILNDFSWYLAIINGVILSIPVIFQ